MNTTLQQRNINYESITNDSARIHQNTPLLTRIPISGSETTQSIQTLSFTELMSVDRVFPFPNEIPQRLVLSIVERNVQLEAECSRLNTMIQFLSQKLSQLENQASLFHLQQPQRSYDSLGYSQQHCNTMISACIHQESTSNSDTISMSPNSLQTRSPSHTENVSSASTSSSTENPSLLSMDAQRSNKLFSNESVDSNKQRLVSSKASSEEQTGSSSIQDKKGSSQIQFVHHDPSEIHSWILKYKINKTKKKRKYSRRNQ